MVNVSLNILSLIGSAYMLYGLLYGITMLVIMFQGQKSSLDTFDLMLYLGGAIVVTAFLLIAGAILFFNGWRLDPIMQLSQILLAILIFYLSVKDILHNMGSSQ